MPRRVKLFVAASLVTAVVAIGVIAGAATTGLLSLGSGQNGTVSCAGQHLRASKLSPVQYSLTCVGGRDAASRRSTYGDPSPSTTSTTTPTDAAPPTTAPPTTAPPTTTTTTQASPSVVEGTTGGRWAPAVNATWQWDLSDSPPGPVPDGPVQFIDIDGFDNSAATVAQLHSEGMKVVCYVDVGTAENYRSDFSSFPSSLLGLSNGWPGEYWLDTSPDGPEYSTLQAIMTARFQMCADKGFDAVEPDNLDGSENSTGFNLTVTEGDQYAEWIAAEVHSLGMSVAQKNFEDQSSTLEPFFDFVIEEQCYQYTDCSDLEPYVTAHKAVLDVEYDGRCPTVGLVPGITVMLKDLDLDASPRTVCPTPAAP
ncbi:MAG TPA: endo alpha-1,4 polygalactosaminidase [Acidimicrobiales bacterium]